MLGFQKNLPKKFNEPCSPFLKNMGFLFYQEQQFSYGNVSLPAFSSVRISFVHNGTSQHESVLHPHDLLVNAFTPFPLCGSVKNFHMASIGIHFSLLYRLTGLLPKECRTPKLISPSDPNYTLLSTLFFTPQEEWHMLIWDRIKKFETQSSRAYFRQMARLEKIISFFHSHPQLSFAQISDYFGISYRQIQRDFSAFLGLSPSEYERSSRFFRAAALLKEHSHVDTSVLSGYWDQSHMIKEFKFFSNQTPSQIELIDDIHFPQFQP